MNRWITIPLAAAALTACVTINVYFPAAEAKEAARQFVEKVIGEDGAVPEAEGNDGGGMAAVRPGSTLPAFDFDPLMLVGIAPAHAQSAPDITIRTPAIQAIQARMEERFNSILRAGFDSGALGFGSDGLIVVRDAGKLGLKDQTELVRYAGKLGLKDRVATNQAVADDNRDRKAVYREVAVANGHPEWESQIRGVFARQWIASARSGWWYEDGGAWKQK